MLTVKDVFDAVTDYIEENPDVVTQVCTTEFLPPEDPAPAFNMENWVFLNPNSGEMLEGEELEVSASSILDVAGDNELIFDCDEPESLRACVIVEDDQIVSINIVAE